MRAGPLNRYCKIIRRAEVSRDTYNVPVHSETVFCEFWAALVPKTEAEQFAASQVYASRVVVFRTHFVDGLIEADTIECEGARYNISGLRELGYRAGLEIAAKLVVGGSP